MTCAADYEGALYDIVLDDMIRDYYHKKIKDGGRRGVDR